jgi:hypothetical protein
MGNSRGVRNAQCSAISYHRQSSQSARGLDVTILAAAPKTLTFSCPGCRFDRAQGGQALPRCITSSAGQILQLSPSSWSDLRSGMISLHSLADILWAPHLIQEKALAESDMVQVEGREGCASRDVGGCEDKRCGRFGTGYSGAV